MREIKFRGKRIGGGEWEYGCLLVKGYHTWILNNKVNMKQCMCDIKITTKPIPVIPETVGQYAEAKDKNGAEIYEGDIISLVTEDGEPITIECKFGKVQRQIFENLVEITGFYFERSNDGRKTFPIVNNYLHKHDTEIWQVIGNIHDNPELIKG